MPPAATAKATVDDEPGANLARRLAADRERIGKAIESRPALTREQREALAAILLPTTWPRVTNA